MTKRLLMSLLFAVLFVTVFSVSASAASENDHEYKVDSSLAYAEAHWNDGKGLCAEFVSDCLKAGGITDVYERECENLYNQLLAQNWGTAYKLKLTGGTRDRILMADNASKVQKGDPVFFYCNSCRKFTHVVLCNGADANGYMVDYAHNNPHNGRKTTYTYYHCGTDNWTIYSIRMNDSETLYNNNANIKAPKVTSVTNTTSGALVKWNKIEGATSYRVYRRVAGGSWLYLKTVTTESYTDIAALNGREVYYTVRACKVSIWSGYFGGYKFTYMKQVDFTSVKSNNTSIILTWQKNTAGDCYYIYRQVNNGKWARYKDIPNPNTTSFTDTNVVSGNTYRYRIRVGKGYNVSSFNYNGISTIYLSAPGMTGVMNDNGGITITWDSVDGSSEYRIYRRGAGETSWTYLTTVKGNSYTDNNVKSGAYYRYTVRSASGKVFGGYDTNGKVLRCIATPVLLDVVANDSKVTLSWGKVDGATGYYVYHKLEGAKYWTRIAVVTDGSTSYVDTDVEDGKTYIYTVKAFYGYTMSSYDADGIECIVTDEVVLPSNNSPFKREDYEEPENDDADDAE